MTDYNVAASSTILLDYRKPAIDAKTKKKMVIEYKTRQSAGFDIPANHSVTVRAGTMSVIKTGLYVDQSVDYIGQHTGLMGVTLYPEMQIRSRSGLAYKHSIFVLNAPGTIDSDYTGEIMVLLFNAGTEDFEVEEGMRIAQGVLTFYTKGNINVKDSNRAGGFGSTG